MMPMKALKWIAIGITIAVLIVVLILYTVPASTPDGAPEADIYFRLTEVESGNVWDGDVDTDMSIGEDMGILPPPDETLKPLTVYDATIIGVEPDKIYEIEFWITFQGDMPAGAPANLTMYADVFMMGAIPNQNPPPSNTHIFLDGQRLGTVGIDGIVLAPDYTGTAEFTKIDGLYWDGVKNTVTTYEDLLFGSYIDGSQWTCVITTTSGYAGTDAYYGTTTVTITLNVDNSGNVNVSVTDVQMMATEA